MDLKPLLLACAIKVDAAPKWFQTKEISAGRASERTGTRMETTLKWRTAIGAQREVSPDASRGGVVGHLLVELFSSLSLSLHFSA